jgi:hypothetical protein
MVIGLTGKALLDQLDSSSIDDRRPAVKCRGSNQHRPSVVIGHADNGWLPVRSL